ncbi:hypothetical protein FSP39_023614 [Pinctada imbricata]|uniref:Disks large-associated protein 1 n=1 Tax=Pinctada imbricata TaxID=66713 RepID=A0AA89CCY9_PINIB|nr:hypothetical protein FSP39_023614 [Pinctada imbricata]
MVSLMVVYRCQGNQLSPVHVLSREYDHDRTVSYRKAITNQYSDEIKKLAQAKIEENYSPEVTVSAPERERSNSMPSQPETEQPNRLTPSKRTVGGSIGNFFRKLSPRLGRKSRKDKTGSVSSLDSEAQKEKRDDSFSRSRVRQSLMKLMGRGKSRSASRSRSEQGSVDDVSLEQEAGFVAPDRDSRNPQNFSTSSNRILKSIEQNSRSEKDVYHRFKEKQSPRTLGEKNVTNSGDIPQNRTQAVRVTPTRTEPSTKEAGTNEKRLSNNSDKENRTIVNGRVDPTVPDILRDATRLEKRAWAEGETNIDMVDSGPQRIDSPGGEDVRLAGKSPRGLMSGSLGGEGSIGECSLDVNLTGSEPSLSGGVDTASSKRVVLGSRENTIDSSSALSPIAASTPSVCLTEQKSSYRDQENDRFYTHSMPKLADTAEFSIPESTKIPSYLKLSCAVSGYGRYSQYSSYKSIEKRSPYSSCSSLHNSDPRSPEIMPVSRIVSPVSKTRGSNSELGLISPQPLDYRNGHVTNGVLHSDSVTNGQSRLRETYPTGDKKLDGEYFLNLTQEWENRLMSHCQNVEPDIHCPNLPEDAHGKIRAAIGKANLLMSQKFKQFQQLCSEHMFPSEDGKVLKWEDLQGFWDMIKIQADNVDDMFAEIELMRQNGWKELNTHSHSRASSVSSSPKSGSLSLSNCKYSSRYPRRKSSAKPKDTPESSPERTEKMRQAAKSREEARKKMLAEKRAAMKQKQKQQKQSDDVEIFVTDSTN